MLKTGPVDFLELCARREDYHRYVSILSSLLASTTATAAKTSLLKWIRVFSNFVGFFSNLLKMANVGEFPWSRFLEDHSQV